MSQVDPWQEASSNDLPDSFLVFLPVIFLMCLPSQLETQDPRLAACASQYSASRHEVTSSHLSGNETRQLWCESCLI